VHCAFEMNAETKQKERSKFFFIASLLDANVFHNHLYLKVQCEMNVK